MLYYKFRNFEEFKELFGIQQHGNGEKNRRNKILLSYIKNRTLLHNATVSGDYRLLHISNMADLKQAITTEIQNSGKDDDKMSHKVNIKDSTYWSSLYFTDDYMGLCEDGDSKSIRYVCAENGHIFKMRIGKFYRKIILETSFGKTLPEQVITYLCEEMAQEWEAYAMRQMPHSELVVNRDFQRIYNSDCCKENFYSCMTDKDYHHFYENAVDASAAYLENKDGNIIARCIIYNKVTDQYGKVWRLAERQYSSGGENVLKRALVDALIAGGHIDGYKLVGADCHSSRSFVDNAGNSLSDYEFSIECDLDYGETLSYQDSFKSYDIYKRVATNFGDGDIELNTDEGEIEDNDGEYDDYHERYCAETTTVFYHGREMNCDSNDLDDFRWIESVQEYHYEDDVYTCDQCGEYYLSENNRYSEITGEDYCDDECMTEAEQRYREENWTYAEYDEEYFENDTDVAEYFCWNSYQERYETKTIYQYTLDRKIDNGEFHLIDDAVFDEVDENTGLPYGKYAVSETTTEAA